jgi:hypothetical protein
MVYLLKLILRPFFPQRKTRPTEVGLAGYLYFGFGLFLVGGLIYGLGAALLQALF